MAVRSVATFPVKPGAADAFEEAYREGQFLERAVTNPGFIRGELIRPSADPEHFVVVAEWETEADYRAWQANYDQLPAGPAKAMRATLRGEPTSTLGTVILAADRDTTEAPT